MTAVMENGKSANGEARERRPSSSRNLGEPPEINALKLAAMLRECADFVEREEFDPLMYQTLQDFRAYYKIKIPKKASKDESPEKGKKKKKKVVTTTTFIPAEKTSAKDAVETKSSKRNLMGVGGGAGNKNEASTKAKDPPGAGRGIPASSTSASTKKLDAADSAGQSQKSSKGSPFGTTRKTAGKSPLRERPVDDAAIPATATATTGSKEVGPQEAGTDKGHPNSVFGKLKMPKIHLPNPAFVATSKKNAARAKTDIDEANSLAAKAEASARRRTESTEAPKINEHEWCEEHFTMGCACKLRKAASGRQVTDDSTGTSQPVFAHSTARAVSNPDSHDSVDARNDPQQNSTATHDTTPSINVDKTKAPAQPNAESMLSKPAFQRPINPDSPLIANGWIEQQRRSKFRFQWKEVLASVVEGRKPGEETTLWIQREVLDPVSGKQHLEALHQIPIKWLKDITYLDFSSDHRFSLRAYNIDEEFLFKCASDEAAQNWVLTLRSAKDALSPKGSSTGPGLFEKAPFEEEKKGADVPYAGSSEPSAQSAKPRLKISELRAICHGAGVNTVGMERTQLEKAAAEVQARGTYFDPPPGAARSAPSSFGTPQDDERRKEEMMRQEKQRQKELEERQREAVRRQEEEDRRRVVEESRRQAEEARKRKQEEEERRLAEARRQEEEQRRRVVEESRRQAEEARLRQQEEERRKATEQERLRQLAEERRRQDEEILRRRQEEQMRQQQEQLRQQQQQQWQQQQAAWQRQQQEEMQRRQAQEAREADERRRQQEAYQRQQQWYQQQQHAHQQSQPPPPAWNQQQHPQHQHPQGWHAQQPKPPPPQWNHAQQAPPPQQPHPPPPPHGHQQHRQSVADQKYANMANQTENSGQVTITRIKHDILIHWALQPPMMQMLRPIDVLITTIQNVFPPALGVPKHEYFAKWTPIVRPDVVDGNNQPNETKLKKAVRKLRFFLHPDKRPKDFNPEQEFVAKMLWDITSDAMEEFHKQAEQLDWVRS